MPTGTAGVVQAIKEVLDTRARREADVRPSRVVGRNTDGSALLLGLDGECISRGGAGGYQGEIVVQLPSLLNRDGTAGVGVLSQRSTATLLWVDAIEPAIFPQGATSLEVTVTGQGFSPSTQFEFLQPASEEVNDDVTIVAQSFVDAQTYTLFVNVAADAAPLLPGLVGGLAFDDPAIRL